jgi:hypothetical protein
LHITLDPEGASIAARPKGATPPELAEAIRKRKAELLIYLRAEREKAEIDRIALLDAELDAGDRLAKRGYDNDSTAPSSTGDQFLEALN